MGAGCFAIVTSSCSAETIATGPAGAAACAGTLAAAGAVGCKDALDSCVGKRRLEYIKVLKYVANKNKNSKKLSRRMLDWPSWGQIGGCLGSAGCLAIVTSSCTAETIATGPAGAAACAVTLAAAGAVGCKDA